MNQSVLKFAHAHHMQTHTRSHIKCTFNFFGTKKIYLNVCSTMTFDINSNSSVVAAATIDSSATLLFSLFERRKNPVDLQHSCLSYVRSHSLPLPRPLSANLLIRAMSVRMSLFFVWIAVLCFLAACVSLALSFFAAFYVQCIVSVVDVFFVAMHCLFYNKINGKNKGKPRRVFFAGKMCMS